MTCRKSTIHNYKKYLQLKLYYNYYNNRLQIFDSNGKNKSEESLFFIAPCEGYACGNEGPETAVSLKYIL